MTYDVALAVRRAVGTCSFCGAPVRWLMTPGGRVIGVDPVPSTYGRVVEGPPLVGIVLLDGDDAGPDGVLLREHFPVCPKAPATAALERASQLAAAGAVVTRCDSCQDILPAAVVAGGYERHPSCPPPKVAQGRAR